MTNLLLTFESAKNARACWTDRQLFETIPFEGATLDQVASAWQYEPLDRIWAILFAMGLPPAIAREFAKEELSLYLWKDDRWLYLSSQLYRRPLFPISANDIAYKIIEFNKGDKDRRENQLKRLVSFIKESTEEVILND